MGKIWIIRERMDWHNSDPDDATTAYVSEDKARSELVKVIEQTKAMLIEYGHKIADERFLGESGWMRTGADDFYSCWVEEIPLIK